MITYQRVIVLSFVLYFFFNDTATTEIYTLSLHDALPISGQGEDRREHPRRGARGAPLPGGDVHGRADGRGGRTGVGVGRAHVLTPVTPISRMPSSSFKKKIPCKRSY